MPPGSVRRAAWAKTSHTGVFHADLDCPVLRGYAETPPNGYRWLFEMDLDTGTAWLWQHRPSTGWVRAVDDPTFRDSPGMLGTYDYSTFPWRPCLRCGSLQADGTYKPRSRGNAGHGFGGPVQACPRCNLTICDCD